ncbi:AAA family ATPase, partial [Citrobacter freundii]|uniref:AAA family ATPase n=1 Tax=Citrobacter freundii TaxID=546 RepID=UPI001867F380
MKFEIDKQQSEIESNVETQLFQLIKNAQSFYFISGAGSGKTHALITGVSKFVNDNYSRLRVNNQKILCITYTNNAADEIKHRLGDNDLVLTSTIHSYIWDVVKYHMDLLLDEHVYFLTDKINNINNEIYEEETSDKTLLKIRSLKEPQLTAIIDCILAVSYTHLGNNDSLTKNIKIKHQSGVERILAKIISDKDIGIELRSELTFDKLMSDLITYEHKDGEFLVPESQFGLGYASLVSIIGEIIDYTNQSLKETSQSRIRLLCIEEPEVFMHPQMQINFIRHIQEALNEILSSHVEHLNSLKSQILITTHSSHILNSVIHSSNTFDDINYIYLKNGNAANVLLKDKDIADTQKKSLQFEFIKKHIKHQTPDLFFSDAIIFVEGITEERVLNSYIEDNSVLNRMNISVFRIDG